MNVILKFLSLFHHSLADFMFRAIVYLPVGYEYEHDDEGECISFRGSSPLN